MIILSHLESGFKRIRKICKKYIKIAARKGRHDKTVNIIVKGEIERNNSLIDQYDRFGRFGKNILRIFKKTYLLWIRSLFNALPSGIGKSGANSWDVLQVSGEKFSL